MWSALALSLPLGLLAALAIASSVDFNSLVENSARAVAMAFWVGMHYRHIVPLCAPSTDVTAVAAARGVVPTPMLSLVHMPVASVRELVDFANTHVGGVHKACLALVNGPTAAVLSGHCDTLFAVHEYVDWLASLDTAWAGASATFLPVDAPYHSIASVCAGIPEQVLGSWAQTGLSWPRGPLRCSVPCPADGTDLRGVADLDRAICLALTTNMVSKSTSLAISLCPWLFSFLPPSLTPTLPASLALV